MIDKLRNAQGKSNDTTGETGTPATSDHIAGQKITH